MVNDWEEFLSLTPSEEETKILQRLDRTGRPSGNEGFLTRLEKSTGRLLKHKKPGRKTKQGKISSYLRKKINGGYIKKIKLQDSRRNNLLQLVDMISGSILRSLSHKSDAKIYRNIIISREIYVQVWPKE